MHVDGERSMVSFKICSMNVKLVESLNDLQLLQYFMEIYPPVSQRYNVEQRISETWFKKGLLNREKFETNTYRAILKHLVS